MVNSICISKEEKISFRLKITLITSPILASPSFWFWLCINMGYIVISYAEPFNYLVRIIRRRIINNNYFIIVIFLLYQTIKTFFYVFFFISGGKNYTYRRKRNILQICNR